MEVFQALVANGSIWTSLPDRLGPIKNQRCGGDLFSPIYSSFSIRKTYKLREQILVKKLRWLIVMNHFFGLRVLLKTGLKHVQWGVVSIIQRIL